MEIPIQEAVFDEANPNHGLRLVSLVSEPAIGFTAIQFSKEADFKLSIQDEEKRIIFTPVLVPDQQIIRQDKKGNPFYLVFRANTIEQVALQFAKDGLNVKADINHSRSLIPGVTWFESFVLSKDRATSVKGFEGIKEGTWFLTGKVDNEEVWQKIKTGEITGVSIDGRFSIEEPEDQLAALLEEHYKIFKQSQTLM